MKTVEVIDIPKNLNNLIYFLDETGLGTCKDYYFEVHENENEKDFYYIEKIFHKSDNKEVFFDTIIMVLLKNGTIDYIKTHNPLGKFILFKKYGIRTVIL